MSNLPLHPVIVHLPLALAVLLPLVAAGVLLAWWRDWLSGRTWWIVLALQALLVIGGFVALRTGEHDEERVEAVVSEAVLEQHEQAAKLFEIGAVAVLALMVIPVAARRPGVRRASALIATAGSLGVLGLGLNVGHAGGRLVYEQGAANAYLKAPAPGATTTPSPVLAESDDDDD